MFKISIENFARVAHIWDLTHEGRRVPAKEVNQVYALIKPDEHLRTRKQKIEFICKYFEEARDKVLATYYINKYPEQALKKPDDIGTSV